MFVFPIPRCVDREHLITEYDRMAYVKAWAGDSATALVFTRKALDLQRQLSAADSSDPYARLILAAEISNMCQLLAWANQLDEALRDATESVAMVDKLIVTHPNNVFFRQEQITIYVTAADVARHRGEWRSALPYYQSATSFVRRSMAEDPKNRDAQVSLAATLDKVAYVLARVEKFNAANSSYQEALSIAGPDIDAKTDDARYVITEAYAGLANVELQLTAANAIGTSNTPDHLAAACRWYDRSIEQWKQIREPGAMTLNGFEVLVAELSLRPRAKCHQI